MTNIVKLEDLTEIIDCQGSGTTLRTLLPFLAITETNGKAITVIGNESLSQRPIGQAILDYIEGSGFLFVHNNGKLPFTVLPRIKIEGKDENSKIIRNAIIANLGVINEEVKRQQLGNPNKFLKK